MKINRRKVKIIRDRGTFVDKAEIKCFFDSCAPNWDVEMVKNEKTVDCILDLADIKEGSNVFDIACGTGVLFPNYLERGVSRVVGIDISEEMIKKAKVNIESGIFPGRCVNEKSASSVLRDATDKITLCCKDVEETTREELAGYNIDRIMVYNAFPHFPSPELFVKHIYDITEVGSIFTIAHGMSRKRIDEHHKKGASRVSNGLISEDELEKLMSGMFEIRCKISNDEMYVVSGRRKA